MDVIEGNLLDVTEGAICHQVNCRGAFGAGVSGAIGARYPEVERAYRAFKHSPAMLGMYQRVQVLEKLAVYNIFGQIDYGNSARTGRVYTYMPALTTALRDICITHEHVYVPFGIGCGLAGGSWEEFTSIMNDVKNLTAVRWSK